MLLRRGFDRCGGCGGEDYCYERDFGISMDFGAGIYKVKPMKILSWYNWCNYFYLLN